MDYIKIIPRLRPEHILKDAAYYDNCGADELYYYDARSFEDGQEEDVKTIKAICREADIPLNVMSKVLRFEDVKKMFYAGAKGLSLTQRITITWKLLRRLPTVSELTGSGSI